MPTHFLRHLSLSSLFALLVGMATISSFLHAQESTADVVNKIQARYDQDKAALVEALRNLPDSPASMNDGSFSSTLSTLSSELDDLSKQLQAANQILDSKRTSLSTNNGLSDADKSELSLELNRQQQPLNELAGNVVTFKSKVNDLMNKQLPSWKDQYQTFSDVEGIDAAKEKLSTSIKSFIAKCSYAPSVPNHRKKS